MEEIFTAPWYPWYPDRFLKSDDAASLTATEECWYRRALDRAWMKGSVPADPTKFADVIGKRCTVKAAEKILELFWKPMDGHPTRQINTTLESIRAEQAHKYNVARERASKGGKAKASKNAGESASSTTQAMPTPSYIDKEREEEEKEEKKREEDAPPKADAKPKRGSRIPDVFLLTSEMKTYAAEKRPLVNVVEETEKFCNHFRSATGRNATKLDWRLTWNNWILNARGQNATSNGHNPKRDTSTDRLRATAEIYDKYPTEAELGREP